MGPTLAGLRAWGFPGSICPSTPLHCGLGRPNLLHRNHSLLLLTYIHNQGGPLGLRFFFSLRTTLKDRPQGPSTANHQPPPTANRHQPPTANCRQLPAATNRQPPITANRHQPPIPNHQLPPTTTICRQPPSTATNRHQLPIAHRQLPTADTWCARGHFWEPLV